MSQTTPTDPTVESSLLVLLRHTREPIIYVASAYSHPDPAIRRQRADRAAAAAAGLFAHGVTAYSPIAHGIALESSGLIDDMPHHRWIALCAPMLAAASALYIVSPHEDDPHANTRSTGLRAEILMATACGTPIVHGTSRLTPKSLQRDAARLLDALLPTIG